MRDVPVAGKQWNASGENVLVADLLDNIEQEGPRTTLLSFAGVCLLVFLAFRRLRTSLDVVGSLTVGLAVDDGANVAAPVRSPSRPTSPPPQHRRSCRRSVPGCAPFRP